MSSSVFSPTSMSSADSSRLVTSTLTTPQGSYSIHSSDTPGTVLVKRVLQGDVSSASSSCSTQWHSPIVDRSLITPATVEKGYYFSEARIHGLVSAVKHSLTPRRSPGLSEILFEVDSSLVHSSTDEFLVVEQRIKREETVFLLCDRIADDRKEEILTLLPDSNEESLGDILNRQIMSLGESRIKGDLILMKSALEGEFSEQALLAMIKLRNAAFGGVKDALKKICESLEEEVKEELFLLAEKLNQEGGHVQDEQILFELRQKESFEDTSGNVWEMTPTPVGTGDSAASNRTLYNSFDDSRDFGDVARELLYSPDRNSSDTSPA